MLLQLRTKEKKLVSYSWSRLLTLNESVEAKVEGAYGSVSRIRYFFRKNMKQTSVIVSKAKKKALWTGTGCRCSWS